MDEFVKQVVESADSEDMARLMSLAEPAAREHLEAAAVAYWNKPGLDRQAASDLFLRMATGFARCKDYERAFRLAGMLADSALESGDRERLSPALGTLGVILMESGLTVEARRVFEKILALAEESGDARLRAQALHNLGVVEAMEGHDIRAVGCFEEALQLARATGEEEIARVAGRFLELARQASEAPPAPPKDVPPAALLPCPQCQGQGLVQKEDYGLVLCPSCKGACHV